MDEFSRYEEQCNGCACYWANLDYDTKKEVAEAAPGVECTLEQQCWDNSERCRFFQPAIEE